MIVSMQEWRRRHRGPDEEECGRWASETAAGLGDEIILRACSEVAAGRSVEVHRLAADAVVRAGDVSLF